VRLSTPHIELGDDVRNVHYAAHPTASRNVSCHAS
jgi:hypothetical protein